MSDEFELLTDEERRAIFEAARALATHGIDGHDADALLATFAALRAIDRSILEVVAVQLIHLAKLASTPAEGAQPFRQLIAAQHANALLHLSRIVHIAAHGD